MARVQKRYDGAAKLLRFPENVHRAFGTADNKFPFVPAEFSTGCEIRFVGNDADIVVSGGNTDGYAEIYRGDFHHSTEYIREGIYKRIVLRADSAVDKNNINDVKTDYAKNVWRIVFSGAISAVIHDIVPLGDIRPPFENEVPKKTILVYGTSVTQGVAADVQSDSYVSVMGRTLGVNTLNKGMGGSCFCEKELAEYIADETYDICMLEPAGNMLSKAYPADEFKKRLDYILSLLTKKRRTTVILGTYRFLGSAEHNTERYDEYCTVLSDIYNKYKENDVYYIDGRKIMDNTAYLCSDLTHPSGYGHYQMGLKIADILKNDFGIL